MEGISGSRSSLTEGRPEDVARVEVTAGPFNLFEAADSGNPDGIELGWPLMEDIPADLAERHRALDLDQQEMGTAVREGRKMLSKLQAVQDDLARLLEDIQSRQYHFT